MSPVPWPRTYDTPVTADVTVPTTTETVVATVGPISVDGADRRVQVTGWVQLTTGAGTTTVTLRIRRGTGTTGALVGEANPVSIASAAGGTDVYEVDVQDTPGDTPSQMYALTVQQAGATGNGAVLQAKLRAVVLP